MRPTSESRQHSLISKALALEGVEVEENELNALDVRGVCGCCIPMSVVSKHTLRLQRVISCRSGVSVNTWTVLYKFGNQAPIMKLRRVSELLVREA